MNKADRLYCPNHPSRRARKNMRGLCGVCYQHLMDSPTVVKCVNHPNRPATRNGYCDACSRVLKNNTPKARREYIETFRPARLTCAKGHPLNIKDMERSKHSTRYNCLECNKDVHLKKYTACAHGHEFTEENTITYVSEKGRTTRLCRTCKELRAKGRK